ncbi:hypothetical protein HPP92_026412 [Vanilla planifolia]|uniref:RING-type domain-containing protein n=1 Tax=Vanilla planifolia TaxID=51239 RepID=A0A835PIL0_VANPL|nr:hypothetical protein HPP92_026636 [Vanilla planifolia]KAG0451066.1 hypothetical protein HPP92_026412 [Vanilla planifolia]
MKNESPLSLSKTSSYGTTIKLPISCMPSFPPVPPAMAGQAPHLLGYPSSALFESGEVLKAVECQTTMVMSSAHNGVVTPLAAGYQLSAPFYASGLAPAPSESGLTVAGSNGRKRQREQLSFLGDDLSNLFNQQMIDLDRLLAHHTERMRAELAERRKRFSRQLAVVVETVVRKRLKAKDDEIEKVKKLNWAMEERIRTLCVENQVWRELAQTNEATANLLRSNLEQLLAAQIQVKEECDDDAAANDAESCCCGENDDRDAAEPLPSRPCRRCGAKEATMLLLPCRHLSLCAACCPATDSCPICNSFKSGSVNVNLL